MIALVSLQTQDYFFYYQAFVLEKGVKTTFGKLIEK